MSLIGVLTKGEGDPEASSTDRGIRDKLEPEHVANDRGVIGGEGVPTEATNQRTCGVRLTDFQEVIVAVGTRLKLEHTIKTYKGKTVFRFHEQPELLCCGHGMVR